MRNISLTILAAMLFFVACKDSMTETTLELPDAPFNPFDTIQYDQNVIPEIPVDSNTFLGLHTYVFNPSCNQPACHDGTFEPDFRTVQSAYNTLVLHPVKKNFPVDPVSYRVTPGDPQQSMMYRRITEHNPPNFERMPSSGNPLPDNLVQLIENWILDGARDIYGNLPMPTSPQPSCFGLLATLPDNNDIRVDTIRGDFPFNPFIAPADQTLRLSFIYLDATPAGDTIFGNELGHNTIRLSTDPFGFDNAIELNMNVPFIPELVASAFSQPLAFPVPYYQNITFNPADYGFETGDLVYMRTYVRDSDHNEPTEIPATGAQFFLQTYFSFIIQ